MALSQSVENSLKEASSSLRNALAFAARQERSHTCQHIAKVLNDIDLIQRTDEMFDTLDSIKDGKGGSNPFGKFGFDE
jgi:hypothetical protein